MYDDILSRVCLTCTYIYMYVSIHIYTHEEKIKRRRSRRRRRRGKQRPLPRLGFHHGLPFSFQPKSPPRCVFFFCSHWAAVAQLGPWLRPLCSSARAGLARQLRSKPVLLLSISLARARGAGWSSSSCRFSPGAYLLSLYLQRNHR